jgi:hypothetical protein
MYLIYLHFKFFLFMHNIFKLFYKINIDIINWLRQSEVLLVELLKFHVALKIYFVYLEDMVKLHCVKGQKVTLL